MCRPPGDVDPAAVVFLRDLESPRFANPEPGSPDAFSNLLAPWRFSSKLVPAGPPPARRITGRSGVLRYRSVMKPLPGLDTVPQAPENQNALILPPGLKAAVVVPVYNHPRQAAGVLERAKALGMPVIVVDDGSTDETPSVLAGVEGLILIRHPANLGKGAALLTCLAVAAGMADWALTLDADGQHDPLAAGALFKALTPGWRGIVVGCRQDMDREGAPWTSRFGRGFSNFWVWASGGGRLSDTQSGFRLYPLPETLALGVRARRFQFEVEVLARAGWRGMPVREAPVPVVYPEERISHFRPGPDFRRNTTAFARLILARIFLSAARRRRMTGGGDESL